MYTILMKESIATIIKTNRTNDNDICKIVVNECDYFINMYLLNVFFYSSFYTYLQKRFI